MAGIAWWCEYSRVITCVFSFGGHDLVPQLVRPDMLTGWPADISFRLVRQVGRVQKEDSRTGTDDQVFHVLHLLSCAVFLRERLMGLGRECRGESRLRPTDGE